MIRLQTTDRQISLRRLRLELLLSKSLSYRIFPELENRPDILIYFQRVRHPAEPPKGQRILHFIDDSGSVCFRDKPVFMMPEVVRPLELHIHETVRRVPLNNLRRPANRKNSPAQ